jgi:hypothetical protein
MALKKWTNEEVAILNEYAFSPMRELMQMLPGRKRNAIYWKLGILGYNRETYRRYTVEEDDFIKKNCAEHGNRYIAKHLRRTEKSIAKRMIVLGLKRSDEQLFVMRGKNRGCFKKGRSSEKAFKEGVLQLCFDERSGNTFYNIKIGKKFVRFSRYLYEQYNNEVLSSSDIVFHKDGNSMNLLKENLIKINRIELMRNNIDKDDAFLKRILRISDPEIIERIKSEFPDLINIKKSAFKLNKEIKKHE